MDAGQVVEAADAGHADGAHRRPDHPSARARPDRRHARPQHLDPRRHLAARADERDDDDGGRGRCSTCGRRRRGSTTSRSRSRSAAQKNFRGQNPDPGTAISYWLKGDAGNVRIDISDVTGRVVRTHRRPEERGLNRVRWDLRGNPPQRGAGAAPARRNSRPPPRRRRSRRRRIHRRLRRPRASRAPDARIDRRRRHRAGRRARAADAARRCRRDSRAGARRTAQGGGGGGGGRGRGGFGGRRCRRHLSRQADGGRQGDRTEDGHDRGGQPPVDESVLKVLRAQGC